MSFSLDPLALSRARSGGTSQRVPMMQGQSEPSPGPQVWFKGRKDDETGEPIPVAEVYTIRLGIDPPALGPNTGDDPLAISASAYAWILSSVAGNVLRTKVSIGYRTALTLTAEAVNISIHDDTDPSLIPESGAVPYSVTVQIAPGLRASFEAPPTLKAFTDIVNGAASVQSGAIVIDAYSTGNARYPIPPNAGVVGVEILVVGATDPTQNPMNIVATAMAGDLALKTWSPGIDKGVITLPPSATYLEIVNFDNADGATFYVTVTWIVEG